MAYGLGASIVIIGALFKILHWQIGFLTGGLLLAVGLITEAVIFAISAFEPVEEDLDWSLVYPELEGGAATRPKGPEDAEGLLSKKLDELLRDAKIDSELMGKLGESIRDFGAAAKNMAPTTEAVHATKKYGEELSHAASQMEVLNSLYKIQIEVANHQAANEELSAGAIKKYGEELSNAAVQMETLNNLYKKQIEVTSQINTNEEISVDATKKYGEELAEAADRMEALNNLYKTQLEITNQQAIINKEINENSDKLKTQLAQLNTNLSSLNGVYGGMLSAMNRN